MVLQNELSEDLWNATKTRYQNADFTGAITDAFVYLSNIIRDKADLSLDGLDLINKAFSEKDLKIKINRMETKVKVKCISKKGSLSHSKENPIATAIELQVPYDPNSIYFQLSGGTGIMLNTVNIEAANMFVLGNDYDVVIRPSVPE